jgi:hypothetical protein
LPGWRRALVHRRCNRVFGKYWTRLADELPDDGSGTKGLTAMVVSSKLSAAGKISDDPLGGLFHQADMEEPGTQSERGAS